jgi:NADH dehydrogenase FAD-containing subunit
LQDVSIAPYERIEDPVSDNTRERPSVVVLGGGYGGINVAKALDDVADVTLVDPKQAFVHNVAAWRALVEPEWLDRIFLPYDSLLAHGRFIRDRAVAVDGRRVTLGSGTELEPDFLVLATGSAYPFPAKDDEPDTETARARYREAHEALLAANRVLLIGAGPAGLELAGEIKAFFPEKHVTIAAASPDVLPGPYDQALRDELRRQLDELGVELRLGVRLRDLPASPPATLAPVVVTTESGEELHADIWYRAFGVDLRTAYLRGALAEARDEGGYIRVDEHLRVHGQDAVFAVGDITDADRNMAGMATMEAKLLAGNIRTLITGEGDLAAYEPYPTAIVVPLGPEGGAGQLPGQEGVAGAEMVAGIKGRDMGVANYTSLFDAAVPVQGG